MIIFLHICYMHPYTPNNLKLMILSGIIKIYYVLKYNTLYIFHYKYLKVPIYVAYFNKHEKFIIFL
ncbi:UNVERIFIED_CONTAM: hypothetical protein Cloal_2023 [Acetivibrio alkalicellulosi]